MKWMTVVLQFYSFPQPLFHAGCTALPVKVKVDVPRGHLQFLVAPSTHRTCSCTSRRCLRRQTDLLFPGDKVKLCAAHSCSITALSPSPVPLWLERKSKRKMLAASRGYPWDQWVQRRYSCASSSLTLEALVCLPLHSAPFGCELEQGFGLLPLIPSRAVLGWSGNQFVLICFAGQSKRLGLSDCFPSSLVRGH